MIRVVARQDVCMGFLIYLKKILTGTKISGTFCSQTTALSIRTGRTEPPTPLQSLARVLFAAVAALMPHGETG